jgi:hypothetical protein
MSIEESYRDASAIFVGHVVSVSQKPFVLDGRHVPHLVTEDAILLVTKSWKGARVGDRVRLQADIGGGQCGISVRNNPISMISGWTPNHKPIPAKVSDNWLIFGFGPGPFGAVLCNRSGPVNFKNVQEDERWLDRHPRRP